MSMPIVAHVRTKSQTKGSALALLYDVAIYANDCCGVAWPTEPTLTHDLRLSLQRLHELKQRLTERGELVMSRRPGRRTLYFIAFHGRALGPQGEYLTTKRGEHQPGCPLRDHPVEIPTYYPVEIPTWSMGDPVEISTGYPVEISTTKTIYNEREKEAVSLSREDRLAIARRLGLTPGSPGWLAYVGDS
jgi:hypothetical protein